MCSEVLKSSEVGCSAVKDYCSELKHYLLNEGITMCLEIKYYNISVRQHNLIIYL